MPDNGRVLEMTREEFEELVAEALDRITIYRGPTSRMCETREDVVAETEVTVVHDIPPYTSSEALSPVG